MSFERSLRGLVMALVATPVSAFAQGLQPMDSSVVDGIFTILRTEAQWSRSRPATAHRLTRLARVAGAVWPNG